MCGIIGELSAAGPTSLGIEEALSRLRHRGPDDQGCWQCDQGGSSVFLGMRRLSIIDLEGGHQPIWNEDETCCIVYNGELYNFLELRKQLEARGHHFRTHTDTEVVLHAFEEWGTGRENERNMESRMDGGECLRRLNGMFALAIWDVKRRSLFLARDRIGEKPLYYYLDGERLVFASEIKALVALDSMKAQAKLSLRGLANYLALGHASAPDTIYQRISKLLPGHFLLAQANDGRVTAEVRRYWDVGAEPQPDDGPGLRRTLSEEDFASQVRDLLDDSVRRRMVADVPVGAFLSGGVDSSAVVALMKRHASGPIKTFSLGFTVGGGYNELPEAREVAQYLGTEHHELLVEHTDLVQTLRMLVYHYDEPFGDAAGFPIYLLSKFARQQVKVVLAGDGGDELFGGYRRYAADATSALYQRLPRPVAERWLPALVGQLPRMRRLKRLAQTLHMPDPAYRYASWLVFFSPNMQAELLDHGVSEALDGYDPLWPYPHYYSALDGRAGVALDHLNRLMYIDLKTWLPDMYMEKTDKATMACSLEARLPLLDHRLVELAFRIPGHYKVRGWSTKRILKKAVRDLVPPGVLRRPKHGFAVPTDPWFRGALKEFAFEVLLDERTRRRGYFNMAVVERLWREHGARRHAWDGQLWLLLNFELWQRIYLDGEGV